MRDGKKISPAVIKRLPMYYRYLKDLIEKGIHRISSKELAERMGITASQMRQDLNNFGCFGQQGYGYNVEVLYEEIVNIMGLDRPHTVILIGAGKFGQVLVNYPNFKDKGFNFIAVFDKDPTLIGTEVNGIEIIDVKFLEVFLRENTVDIVALAVPGSAANKLVLTLAKHDIKGIWNFSQNDLSLPENIIVEDVRLSDSLMTLSYKMHEKEVLSRAVRDFW
ncbi:MAG: redox-sensing transcriptional repressor Rex [Defluviitaleaceae bacterium]|nr:redox-sensing transcriptional repressor Rex [Defluviitaleaceae bacterium]